jgi:hypothetical protein
LADVFRAGLRAAFFTVFFADFFSAAAFFAGLRAAFFGAGFRAGLDDSAVIAEGAGVGVA